MSDIHSQICESEDRIRAEKDRITELKDRLKRLLRFQEHLEHSQLEKWEIPEPPGIDPRFARVHFPMPICVARSTLWAVFRAIVQTPPKHGADFEELAHHSGLSASTVRRALKELERIGYVHVNDLGDAPYEIRWHTVSLRPPGSRREEAPSQTRFQRPPEWLPSARAEALLAAAEWPTMPGVPVPRMRHVLRCMNEGVAGSSDDGKVTNFKLSKWTSLSASVLRPTLRALHALSLIEIVSRSGFTNSYRICWENLPLKEGTREDPATRGWPTRESDERIGQVVLPNVVKKVRAFVLVGLLRDLDYQLSCGRATISVEELARDRSVKHCIRAIDVLRELGFIEFARPKGGSLTEHFPFRICWESIPLTPSSDSEPS